MEDVIGAGTAAGIRVCPGTECGVSRRAFVGATLAAAAAALLAGCGDGQIGPAENPFGPDSPGAGTVIRVADYPALAQVGGIVRVDTPGGSVAVVHAAQGTYAVLSMRCPHQGTRVNISGNAFVCPNHNARFNAAGQWTGGQRTGSLVPVPFTYSAAAGTITLGAGAG